MNTIGGTADLHLTYHADEYGLSFVFPLENNSGNIVQVHGGGYNEPIVMTYSLNDYIRNIAAFSHTPTLMEAFMESVHNTLTRRDRLRRLQEATDDLRAVLESGKGTGSDEGLDAAEAMVMAAEDFLLSEER